MAPKASPPVIDPLSIPRLQLVLTLKDIKHKAGTRLRIEIVHPTWVAKVFMSDTASERVEQIIAAAPEIKVSDITDEFAIALHGAKAGQPHMRPATAPVPVTMPPEVAVQPRQSPRQMAGTPEAPFMHSEHSVRDDYKSRNLGSRNDAVRDVSYSDAVAQLEEQGLKSEAWLHEVRRVITQADVIVAALPPEHAPAVVALQDALMQLLADADDDDDADADEACSPCPPCEPEEAEPSELERKALAFFTQVREELAWSVEEGPPPATPLALLRASYQGRAGGRPSSPLQPPYVLLMLLLPLSAWLRRRGRPSTPQPPQQCQPA